MSRIIFTLQFFFLARTCYLRWQNSVSASLSEHHQSESTVVVAIYPNDLSILKINYHNFLCLDMCVYTQIYGYNLSHYLVFLHSLSTEQTLSYSQAPFIPSYFSPQCGTLQLIRVAGNSMVGACACRSRGDII